MISHTPHHDTRSDGQGCRPSCRLCNYRRSGGRPRMSEEELAHSREASAHSKSLAALAKKSQQLRQKDAEWLASLPLGEWVTTLEAAALWGVCRGYAWERLDLLKAAGLVWKGGTGVGRRWRKV